MVWSISHKLSSTHRVLDQRAPEMHETRDMAYGITESQRVFFPDYPENDIRLSGWILDQHIHQLNISIHHQSVVELVDYYYILSSRTLFSAQVHLAFKQIATEKPRLMNAHSGPLPLSRTLTLSISLCAHSFSETNVRHESVCFPFPRRRRRRRHVCAWAAGAIAAEKASGAVCFDRCARYDSLDVRSGALLVVVANRENRERLCVWLALAARALRCWNASTKIIIIKKCVNFVFVCGLCGAHPPIVYENIYTPGHIACVCVCDDQKRRVLHTHRRTDKNTLVIRKFSGADQQCVSIGREISEVYGARFCFAPRGNRPLKYNIRFEKETPFTWSTGDRSSLRVISQCIYPRFHEWILLGVVKSGDQWWVICVSLRNQTNNYNNIYYKNYTVSKIEQQKKTVSAFELHTLQYLKKSDHTTQFHC